MALCRLIQNRYRLAAVAIFAFTFTAASAPAQEASPSSTKKRITHLDDLPQHAYPCPGKPSEVVSDHKAIAELAAAVKKDVTTDLDTLDIADDATRQQMYGYLLTVALVEGEFDKALELIEVVRKLEDKEGARLTTGMDTQAIIEAARKTDAHKDMDAYRTAYKAALLERLNKLPWDKVQDIIQQTKGRAEIVSENVVRGSLQANLDSVCDKTGELNLSQAASLVSAAYLLHFKMPLRQQTIEAYAKFIDAHHEEKPDIWQERSVTLTPGSLHSVLLAVWDSGADEKIFQDQLWTNPNEKIDGQDDDGNGYIDDVHGIAYDHNARRTTGTLAPLGEAESRIGHFMDYMKGLLDIQASLDSPEASALKQHLSTLSPADFQNFLENLNLAGHFAHGTHVAGIMLDGNPAAKLLIARHSYDYHHIPVARTEEWGERDGKKCLDTVAYLKDKGVRVVNMSWGEAQRDAEDSLEKNGIGKDQEERRAIARKVFQSQKQGLYEAIQNAPEILFICAAGNADNNVEFDEDIPSSFDLPNLLVVGAVDQAGDPTHFTSFGKTVEVYASGFEVESYIPGGRRMKMSGTSMASPNVANLAGKILAVDPSLKPAEVIELIKKGADRKAYGEHEFLLLNPKNTIELLRKKA